MVRTQGRRDRYALILLILALFGAGLVVATTASGPDMVVAGETDVLELEPHPDSRGIYADFDKNGRFQVMLTEENPNIDAKGVNPNAITDIGNVLVIENVREEGHNATVWIEHDGVGVKFYSPDHGVVESEEDGVTLQPGETLTVAMLVDTTDTDEDILIEQASVVALLDPDVESGGSGGDSQLSSGDDSVDDDDSGTETPESTETDTETESATEAPETGTPTPNQSQSTPSPTVTDDSTSGDGTTETDDQTDEQAGLGSSMLLGIVLLLLGIVAAMLLFRRLAEP